MIRKSAVILGLVSSVGLLAGCSDNQGVNAATGALAGAAIGSQVGSGSGTTAATLAGAAIGAQVGASQPTNRQCTYRDPVTGGTYQAACS